MNYMVVKKNGLAKYMYVENIFMDQDVECLNSVCLKHS